MSGEATSNTPIPGNETEIDLGTPEGHPVPTVVWTFNGQGVNMGGRINLIDGRKLKIDPTQLSDQGIWQATATNKAGSSQHAIYLKIQEELEFVGMCPQDGEDSPAAQITLNFHQKLDSHIVGLAVLFLHSYYSSDPPSDGKNTYIAQYTTVVCPCNVRGTPTPNNWEW